MKSPKSIIRYLTIGILNEYKSRMVTVSFSSQHNISYQIKESGKEDFCCIFLKSWVRCNKVGCNDEIFLVRKIHLRFEFSPSEIFYKLELSEWSAPK